MDENTTLAEGGDAAEDEGRAGQGKARQGKARQGKARMLFTFSAIYYGDYYL